MLCYSLECASYRALSTLRNREIHLQKDLNVDTRSWCSLLDVVAPMTPLAEYSNQVHLSNTLPDYLKVGLYKDTLKMLLDTAFSQNWLPAEAPPPGPTSSVSVCSHRPSTWSLVFPPLELATSLSPPTLWGNFCRLSLLALPRLENKNIKNVYLCVTMYLSGLKVRYLGCLTYLIVSIERSFC